MRCTCPCEHNAQTGYTPGYSLYLKNSGVRLVSLTAGKFGLETTTRTERIREAILVCPDCSDDWKHGNALHINQEIIDLLSQ